MKYFALSFVFFLIVGHVVYAQIPADRVTVSPKEIDSVLLNPGIGFNTFQHFNGDTLFPGSGWSEGSPIVYQNFGGSTFNKNYPQTTIAYWRVYWKYMEPEKQEYRWDLLDQALDSARRRGQKLLLRIAPYGSDPKNTDVPEWYRKMVGAGTNFKYNNPVNKWMVDAEDPRYAQYFGGLIRALGKKYDANPDIEAVDLSIVGAWGEGGGSALLSEKTRKALIGAYTESFKTTPLLALLTDEKTNRYADTHGPHTGWRADCLGDLGFWAKDQNGWTHMYDYYPQSIIQFGLQDTWKKAPVSFEICGTFLRWRDQEKYGEKEVKYIFDEALKWHISSFNAKSSPVPAEWKPLVDDWLKKMGYRFVLKRFSYSRVVEANGKFLFDSWWENKGVAPCYVAYPVAVRLKNNQHSYVMLTKADITKWLPGDNLLSDSLSLPPGAVPGEYTIEIAVLNNKLPQHTNMNRTIRLAIEGITPDGWYTIGKMNIR
ncbi:MAG: DUF4832 domain-containing protein [Chitinophagaceae bacterium]|nr:DUF4832 domain-containing protein [Chitinophagaceae bacterium]